MERDRTAQRRDRPATRGSQPGQLSLRLSHTCAPPEPVPITKPVRIIKHEAVPDCGSFEVRFADGRPSRYWYWDDLPSRRLRPEQMTQEQAKAAAQEFARGVSER